MILFNGTLFETKEQNRLLDDISDRIDACQIEDGVADQILCWRKTNSAISPCPRDGYG